jgi:ribonuclease M5
MERLKIPYPVIVEGRYDKLRLESVIEAHIIPTDGFGIFKKEEKASMFRALAKKTPLILLTDSDGAGKLIRSHLTSVLPKERLIQLYVPRISGKEKRKNEPSAEGILGVEGMERELLFELFKPYANAQAVEIRMAENPLCKTDFYEDGLTGKEGSSERRDALCAQLGLPLGMTPNALLAALRVLCTYEEYCALVGRN